MSKIKFILGDITKLKVDVIVNAANNTLLGGGGVDGAIHAAAGPGLLEECKSLNGCETGKAKITKAYRLPAKFVIHTVGPVWRGGAFNEEKYLQSAYTESLRLALKNNLNSIAFPAISCGVYNYPKEEAAFVALNTTMIFLKTNKIDIYFVLFNEKIESIFKKIYKQFLEN